MRMRDFISNNRDELVQAINGALNRYSQNKQEYKLTNKEIQDWIANDEGLYLWARREGVPV